MPETGPSRFSPPIRRPLAAIGLSGWMPLVESCEATRDHPTGRDWTRSGFAGFALRAVPRGCRERGWSGSRRDVPRGRCASAQSPPWARSETLTPPSGRSLRPGSHARQADRRAPSGHRESPRVGRCASENRVTSRTRPCSAPPDPARLSMTCKTFIWSFGGDRPSEEGSDPCSTCSRPAANRLDLVREVPALRSSRCLTRCPQ